MSNLRSLFVFVLFFSLNFFGYSQEKGVDSDLLLSQISLPEDFFKNNITSLVQVGNNNTTLNQQGINNSLMSQEGNGNIGYIDQSGSQNVTNLVQLGNSNDAGLWSIGENVTINATQTGNENQINAYIENYDISARIVSLNQLGDRNSMEVALLGNGFSGSGNQTFEANQVGNDLSLNAIIDPFSIPIKVEQTSGIGGAGINVDISTSTFNFPMRK